MWKNIRIALLLLVLAAVAVNALLDRIATSGWKDTLWVGIFPINGDGTPMAQHYVEGLTAQDFSGIDEFFAREAHHYGVAIEQPVHAELYPQGSELPPALAHDAATLDRVPDSLGLQKGLIGVVHAFAQTAMAGSNNIVIAHELMHTLGASDKYDLGSGAPLYPSGFAEPDREPLYPQGRAEIMAGRRALSRQDFEMPQGLRDVVVGPATALEIRWTRP